METEQSQSGKDGQDAMDWGQERIRRIIQGADVGTRARESVVLGGNISLESCSGVGGLYGCQDTARMSTRNFNTGWRPST